LSSPESFLEEMNKIKKARKRFIETGEIDFSVIRPIIANSWKRCKLAKVSPFLKNSIIKPKDKEIKVLLDRNRHLIKISQPIMGMAEKMIKGSGFRIDLSNKDGYILKMIGDKKILEESEKIGVVVGSNRSEIIVGTNSIGVTLFTGKPVQIIGPEHYNVYPRYWTCSSAPIRNPSGNIVGVINMSGKYHLLHKHTLGMVVGIANTIESALKIEKKVNELKINNKFLNTIIESISDALVVMDKEGRITHLNSIATEILGKKYSEVIGIPINRLIKTNFSLLNILKSKKRYIEREIKVTPFYSKESHQYLLTEKAIEDSTGKLQGIIGLFKEIKKVHRLVGRIVGANPGLNFSNIIGNNKKLKRAISLAKVSSNSSCKILIQGESGTGKEIFAQAIHNYSNRCDKPFIAINCAAIPRDLVESELFGYEEGAFTSARRGGKPGKFELAEGGTLFLDEIESLPLEAQPKLLRVLESNQLMRVGGSKIISIDVRIISSTNKDLLLAIKEGNFREDLYYRLNTVNINIPPLRERKDDIPILVKCICNKIGQKLGRNEIEVDKEALKLLCNYNWPGNVRELENILENAILLSKGNCITIRGIPENIKHFKTVNLNIKDKKEIDSLINIEKEVIFKVLKDTKGNISKASRVLGIDRSTLYRKIKKFKISK
jgi:PAS domain S-box-containing protein